MSREYGSMNLSAGTLTVMAIVCVSLLVLASIIYMMFDSRLGAIPHFVSVVLLLVLVATWFTDMSGDDWNEYGIFPPAAAIVLLIVEAVPAAIWIEND